VDVEPRYRRLTAEQRADHIQALFLLGRLVSALPPTAFMNRTFYVLNEHGRLM
jgi:hypothetical protein